MAGSRSNLDVYLRLFGQRKFSKEVAASGAELEAMGLKGAKSMAAFAKSADKLKKFGASWTKNVSMPIAALAGVSVYAAVNFKRQMGLIATDAGGTAKEVAKLEPALLKMARTTQYSGTELAESLFHAESAGYRGAKALKVVHEAAKLATAGNSELESTTYGLVSAQKALYGGQDVKNVRKTAAELNSIVSHGDIRLEELVAGMSSGLIEKATQAGVSLRSVGSALDVMTARGIPAQRASYSLGFIFSKLVPYTEPATEAFEELGIQQEKLSKIASGPGGWPAMIEFLASKLKGLSRGQKSIDLSKMFGGGRMDTAVLASLQNVGDLNLKFKQLNPNVALYTKHTKEAEEQPLVKLKQAWGAVQDSLIEIGGELVPVIVPAIEKVAAFGQKAANVFMKIPGPVKAIGVAALIAVGPLSSMLGYFASGVGRFLIVANGLAKAGMRFNTTLSPNVMTEKSGVKGALSAAFGGTGAAGAFSAAKGFATAIGPFVAAAGIGNIISSATSGEWKAAGAEGAGAMIGGLAAMLTGNPELAPLAAGLGSFGGDLFASLFKSTPQVSFSQQRLASSAKEVKSAFGAEKSESEALARSGKSLVTAHHHQRDAAKELKGAEHALAVVRGNAPAGSIKVVEAEIAVAEAIEGVTKARKRAKRAERLHGEDRGIAKEGFQYSTLAGRHRKNVIGQRISELREERQTLAGQYSGAERLAKLRPVDEALTKQNENLAGVNKKLNGLYKEAANEIGPRYAGFLRKAAGAALDLGSELAYVEETAGRANGLFEKLGLQISGPKGPGLLESLGGHPAFPSGRHPRRHHRHDSANLSAKSPLGNPAPLSFKKPTGRTLDLSNVTSSSGGGRDINITVQSVLDKKVVAESTTQVSKEEALLQ